MQYARRVVTGQGSSEHKQWRLERRSILYLVGLTIVALALRIAWIVTVPNTPVSDFASYNYFAVQFAQGVFPQGVTFQGAGYPMVLGLAYHLAHSTNIIYGKIENVVFSVVTLILCYYIFAKLAQSRAVFLVASTITALLPGYIAYSSVLGTEVFFTFCLVASVALLLSSLDWRIQYPTVGVLLGLGTLTKPYLLVFPIVAAVMIWLIHKDIRETLRLLVLSSAFLVLTLSPITYMNYVQLHRFILNTYNGSANLFINSNSDNKVGAWMPIQYIHITPQFRQELQAHGVIYPNVPFDQRYAPLDPLFGQVATHWIETHPMQYAELGVLRLRNTYFSGEWDVHYYAANGITDTQVTDSRGLKIMFDLADISMSFLSVAGFLYIALGSWPILRVLIDKRRKIPAYIVFPTLTGAFYLVIFFASEGQPRYGFPILFMFAFCAAMLVGDIWKGLSSGGVLAASSTTPREALASDVRQSVITQAPDAMGEETLKLPRTQVTQSEDASQARYQAVLPRYPRTDADRWKS